MAPIPAAAPPITPAPAVLDQSIIPMAQPIAVDDEPPNKKLRSEDNLVPEAEFIAMHKVIFNVISSLFIKKCMLYFFPLESHNHTGSNSECY